MCRNFPLPFKAYESNFARIFILFRKPRVLRLCMHCLELSMRIKVLPNEDKNSKKQCMQIVEIDVNASLLLKC